MTSFSARRERSVLREGSWSQASGWVKLQQDGRIAMSEPLLDEDGVRVGRDALVVGEKTYPLENITSARRVGPPVVWGVVLIGIGVLLIGFGASRGLGSPGMILTAAGTLIFLFAPATLVLKTTTGELRPLKRHKAFIDRVVNALNAAKAARA